LAPPSPAPQDIPRAQLLQLRSRGRTASTFFEHPICTQCILSLHTLQSIRHASWTQANESPSSSRASRRRRLSPTTQPHRARTSHSAPSFLLSAAGRLVRRQSSFCGPHHLQPAQARALASFPSPYNTHRPCNNTEPRYGSPLGGRVSSPLTLHWESWELQEFGIYPRAQKEAAAMRRAPFFDAFCYGFFSFGSS